MFWSRLQCFFKTYFLCVLLGVVFCIALTGCKRKVVVEVTPSEAEIYIDSKLAGTGRVEQAIDFKNSIEPHEVIAKCEGYIEVRREITKQGESDPITVKIIMEKQEFVGLKDYRVLVDKAAVRLMPQDIMGHIDVTDRLPLTCISDLPTGMVILNPSIAPDGRRLIFSKIDSDEGVLVSNLWQIVTDGKGTSQITSGVVLDFFPAFGSDGRELFFSSDRNTDHHQLWQTQPEVSTALTLTLSNESNLINPHLSEDGKKVIFELWPKRGAGPIICSLQRDTGLVTQLGIGYSPKWSPDGTKIVYVKRNGEALSQTGQEWRLLKTIYPSNIWVMDANGANPTQLTFDTIVENDHPQWSPDGTKIVFSSTRGYDSKKRYNFDIWIMGASRTNLTQLTINSSQDDYPIFDSTSTFVYFRSNRGGRFNIWRLQLPR